MSQPDVCANIFQVNQDPKDDGARRKSSLRERSAIALSRVARAIAAIGVLVLLAAGPTALYAIAASHAPRWTGTQIAVLGIGLCLIGLLLGVVATLMGRSRYL